MKDLNEIGRVLGETFTPELRENLYDELRVIAEADLEAEGMGIGTQLSDGMVKELLGLGQLLILDAINKVVHKWEESHLVECSACGEKLDAEGNCNNSKCPLWKEGPNW